MDNPVSHSVYLALGSNVGDRLAALRAARDELKPYLTITATSKIYEALPAYVSDQPAFLNAVISGTTMLDPQILLYTVKAAERKIGRTPTFHYGPRIIDIDILFYDDLQLQTTALTLPHPRLAERIFVLRPLADIAPDLQHPGNGKTVYEMLDMLPDADSVTPINETL